MRRFTASGAAASAEVLVNSATTSGDQSTPSIAGLDGGNYVVVWQTPVPSTARTMIRTQVYSGLGVLQGAEVRADTSDTTSQSAPVVTATTGGGFVVAWASTGGATGNGIRGQRFTAAAAKTGKEFAISTTAATQTRPALAGTADGGFVAVWTSFGQTAATRNVFAQRFTATGTRAGAETRINSKSAVDQLEPSVAAFPSRGYLIAWTRKSGVSAATIR